MANKSYPYEIKPLEVPKGVEVQKFEASGFIRVGPKKYVFPENFKNIAADIYNIEVRPSDVFVFSFPRSGTTWTQELVWLVVNDLDYETAKRIPLTERYAFLEFSMFLPDSLKTKLCEDTEGDERKIKGVEILTKSPVEVIENMPSPRFLKSHLPLSMLPPNALDAKMVHIARDPRDAIVSFYHLVKSMKLADFDEDFKSFWNSTIKDCQPWTPFFENVKEAWEKRNHPNMLFLFYEDLRKDLPSAVRRVCDFFGKKFSDEQIAKLCDHLSFENFKNNPSVNYDLMKELGLMRADKDFIRKGKTGGWRDYFDDEMTAQAEQWMAENMRDSDFRYPHLQ